jgi:hypothetical protein
MNESDYGKYVALDAEMTTVIAPPDSAPSEPTQVAITDINGNVLFNEYFQLTHAPRIEMSKARKEKLRKNARRKYNEDARNEVLSVLRGKIVVGHDLFNDFIALRIDPIRDGLAGVLDSVKLQIFKKVDPASFRARSLQNLTGEFLHRRIQGGVMHNALEDSKASANLIRTTFPYLNAPLPVTRDMVTASKVIADYGRRLGLNAEPSVVRKPRLDPGAAEFVGAAPAPAPAPSSAGVNALMLAARRIASGSAVSSTNMPNLLQFEQPVKSAENYMKEMEGLNISKPAKAAKNYMREMKGLMSNNHFAGLVNEEGTVQGRNSRKRVNRRKTRRLRR